ncbi:NAD(P)-binding oxidoreductase [Streptomyces sp. BPTC-684]|uniref:NAD(P)-dependent oxidoreductase n=1 Tax=Streptomyces sp. BPTC-684 TaxID=3043734 RepID=UPI0024B12B97|nr:NAD(P)-binding oxidoreductase [Streptomyces sp. BPTC-684]WHM37194.1 SDR family oxidoreductase [Streptomyces sp. BPTC-684]
MKLTVFGATGRIGSEVVRQALAAGHQVTAVVRDPGRFAVTGAGLEVVRGNLADPESLRPAVAGRDAVLSGLGANKRADAAAGITARLTGSIVKAMDAEGTRRLLMVSAGPVGPEAPDDPFLDRLTLTIVTRVFKDVYEDLRRAESVLAASALDWTAVRPVRLVDKPRTGTYRTAVGATPRSARSIGRADVADAMLGMIDDQATVKQGVCVSY